MDGHQIIVILRNFDVKTKCPYRCTVDDCSLIWRVYWLWRRKILRIMMSHQVIRRHIQIPFGRKKASH